MFGKKKNKKSEEQLRAESLPTAKKVQFEALPLNRVEEDLKSDLRGVLNYTPVNYYAAKDKYLLCVLYYNTNYSEIYMNFELVENDKSKGRSGFWKIDKILLRDILRKFGQQI